jgi:hypothetical protein
MIRFIRFIFSLIKFIFFGKSVNNSAYIKRIDICNNCEYLKDQSVCSICGCYVKIKAKWSSEDCPKNKW